MSRFENLEFDDRDYSVPGKASPPASADPDGPRPRTGPFVASTGTPIRDAAFFLEAADREFRLDNLEPALRNYSRALEQDTTLFDGWLGQVRVLLETGEYNEADLWAGKALELFPEQPELLAVKAAASLRMGKAGLALAQSDHALARPGVTAFVWLARAEILLATRKPMADHCLAKALECTVNSPRHGWSNWEASRLLRRYRRAGRALGHAQTACQLLPGEAGIWLELARCQLALNIAGARLSLEQACALSNDCPAARRLLTEYREPGLLRRWLFRRKG